MRHVCLILTLLSAPAHAACEMDGVRKVCVPGDGTHGTQMTAKFVSAPPPVADSGLTPGDRLPPDAMTVIGTDYLGLPPARDGWAYFRFGPAIYKADFQTRRIIARVSP